MYVLEGVLNVRTWSDGAEGWHELHPGDGFYCPAGTPHRYSNIGGGIAGRPSGLPHGGASARSAIGVVVRRYRCRR